MPSTVEILAKLRRRYGSVVGWWPVDRAWHAAHGTDPRFEVCLGAILTQNTAWANVETALANLKEKGLLDAKRLARAEPAVVREAVRPAGFYNQKTDHVRTFARYVARLEGGLDGLFRGPTEKVRALLLSFDGIGEETADDILVYAAGLPSFIIDAYTRRITRRLGLATGEESYGKLQRLWSHGLPRNGPAFGEAHALLVEHAKRTCLAKNPACMQCPLETVCDKRGVDLSRI